MNLLTISDVDAIYKALDQTDDGGSPDSRRHGILHVRLQNTVAEDNHMYLIYYTAIITGKY